MPKPKPLVKYLSLEGDTIDRVNNVLLAAVQDLNKDIARLQGSSKIGDQVSLLQARQTKAALMRQTDTVFKNIEDVMAQGKRSAAILASKMVSDEENPLLKLLLPSKSLQELADDEARRASATVEAVMARFSSSYKPLSKRVYNSSQLTKGYVDQMVGVQLAKGASWGDFAKAARDMVDPNTPGGVAYAAKRLARTEINNAFHASSAERYKNSKVPGLLIDWNLSGSHKVPDNCNKYDEDGPYEPEEVPGKPHPMCLCFLTARLPDEDDFLDHLFGGEASDDPIVYEPDFDVKAGLTDAEAERKRLEKTTYDAKGNYNAAKGWSSESRSAWTSYTEMGHRDMNLLLRDRKAFLAQYPNEPWWEEEFDKRVKLLKGIIDRTETSQDMVVARGVLVGPGYDPRKLLSGDLFKEPGFLSTTTDLKQARTFAMGRGRVNDPDGWTFIAKVPKGTKAVHGVDYQNEIIFGPGQAQRVIGLDVKKKIVYTQMENSVAKKAVKKIVTTPEPAVKVVAKKAATKKPPVAPTIKTQETLTNAQRRALAAKNKPITVTPIKTPAPSTAAKRAAKAAAPPKIEKLPRLQPELHDDMGALYFRKPVNPHHGKQADRRWNVNCTRTSAAMELRRRGYNVTAGPRLPSMKDNDYANIARMWVDKTGTSRPFSKVFSAQNLERELLKRPEGSRFFVAGAWKTGGAHIWNAEIRNGKLIMYEGQTLLGGDPGVYLSRLKGPVNYLRVDDLFPTDRLIDDKWIYEAGKTSATEGKKVDDLSWLF